MLPERRLLRRALLPLLKGQRGMWDHRAYRLVGWDEYGTPVTELAIWDWHKPETEPPTEAPDPLPDSFVVFGHRHQQPYTADRQAIDGKTYLGTGFMVDPTVEVQQHGLTMFESGFDIEATFPQDPTLTPR